MAIVNAVQRGQTIYVYDDKGRQLPLSIGVGSGPKDGLKGYTSGSVTVQRGSTLYTYNDKGRVIMAVSAK